MEYGSLSDWVSSLCSFGTLIIAYKAYKAAPKWISKKENEFFFEMASEKIPEFKRDIDELYYKLSFFPLDFSQCDEVFLKRLYDVSVENRDKNILAVQCSIYKSKVSVLPFNSYHSSKLFKNAYIDFLESTIKYSNSIFTLFYVIAVFGKDFYSQKDLVTDDFKKLIYGIKESIDCDYKSVIKLFNKLESISDNFFNDAECKA
ncbi:MAG: hypothetical protein KA288_01435 [Paludibacteraceae bacterium]|nr:hypothetical protein [Paludibacteraceae bacterium]